MLGRLILLLTVVPLVELWLLTEVAARIEWGPTIAIVLVTGVLGAALARREGMRVLANFQRELQSGDLPAQSLVDGVGILVAGALLVTPGLITDVVGFALLIAPLRRWAGARISKSLRKHVVIVDANGEAATTVTGTWPPTAGGRRVQSRVVEPGDEPAKQSDELPSDTEKKEHGA